MKVSLNWLKDYLNLDNITVDELSKIISTHIVEIEAENKLVEATCLQIGHVKECVDHENSDHLHVCQVELKDGISQIVCGAPNVAVGQKVIVACPGAVLPGDFKIKASKVRGVESNGMICSLQELGFEDKYIPEEFKDGIYILGEDAVVGDNPLEYMHLNDYIFDLELTSNRSDLLSIEGVAFDIASKLNQTVKVKELKANYVSGKNPVQVEVTTKGAPKYNIRYIKDVVIKESPWWLKSKLIASGIRPINNVVDITNYVLMEMGQPLHSFDADKLGNKILVRDAFEGEKVITLDNIERVLTSTDVVVTDGKDVACIGGVMGASNTEVTNTTKNVALEAAYFDPLCIRRTSTRLGLKSESSTRFERKIDYNRVERALDYACYLLEKYADGKVVEELNRVVVKEIVEEKVEVSTSKINKVLGTNLSTLEITNIFDSLAYEYQNNDDNFIVTIPSRRMDLEGWDQHIIEDVARIYGYDNIPTILPNTNDKGRLTENQKMLRNIRYILSNLGFNETVTYSLVNEYDLNNFTLEENDSIKLLMPMSEDKAVMRQSLLNGIIEAIAYNKARKQDNMAFYEIGKKYTTTDEITLLSGAMTGLYTSNLWKGEKQEADFFLMKGILDNLFAKLNINVVYEQSSTANSNFHPGRTALIKCNDIVIGVIAELHPRFASNNDLSRTMVFELNLDKIIELKNKDFKYHTISKFPTITRDLALVVKKDVTANQILDVIKQTAKKYLIDSYVFDVYEGSNVLEDEKSLAIKLTFQDNDKTLEASDVDKVINSILNRLDFHLKAKLR